MALNTISNNHLISYQLIAGVVDAKTSQMKNLYPSSVEKVLTVVLVSAVVSLPMGIIVFKNSRPCT